MVLCDIFVTNESLQNWTFTFDFIHPKNFNTTSKTAYIYVFGLFFSELIVVKIDHIYVRGNCNRNFERNNRNCNKKLRAWLHFGQFCLTTTESSHNYWIVWNFHYCNCPANWDTRFFVLPSVTRKCNPKDTWTCFCVAPFSGNKRWLVFLETWSISVLTVLIFIPAGS